MSCLLRFKRLPKYNKTSPAITDKMIAKSVGSINKVAMTSIANDNKTMSINGGKPSLYIANMKALYTKAKPNSC